MTEDLDELLGAGWREVKDPLAAGEQAAAQARELSASGRDDEALLLWRRARQWFNIAALYRAPGAKEREGRALWGLSDSLLRLDPASEEAVVALRGVGMLAEQEGLVELELEANQALVLLLLAQGRAGEALSRLNLSVLGRLGELGDYLRLAHAHRLAARLILERLQERVPGQDDRAREALDLASIAASFTEDPGLPLRVRIERRALWSLLAPDAPEPWDDLLEALDQGGATRPGHPQVRRGYRRLMSGDLAAEELAEGVRLALVGADPLVHLLGSALLAEASWLTGRGHAAEVAGRARAEAEDAFGAEAAHGLAALERWHAWYHPFNGGPAAG